VAAVLFDISVLPSECWDSSPRLLFPTKLIQRFVISGERDTISTIKNKSKSGLVPKQQTMEVKLHTFFT
jgi:hypothetical protein